MCPYVGYNVAMCFVNNKTADALPESEAYSCFADGEIFLRCRQLDWEGQRFGGKSLPLLCKETVVKAFQNVEPKGGGRIQ